jgi:hypothetical protein
MLINRSQFHSSVDPNSPESISLRNRVMQQLAPYVAPLSFEMPPPTASRSIIDKMTAKQIQSQIQRQAKSNREELQNFKVKAEKWQIKAQNQRAQLDRIQRRDEASHNSNPRQECGDDLDSGSSWSSDSSSSGDGAGRKVEKKRAKKERKREKKLHRLEKKVDRKGARLDKKIGKQSAKDETKVGKMKFIVVENT